MLKLSHCLSECVTKYANFPDEENTSFSTVFSFLINTQRPDGVLTDGVLTDGVLTDGVLTGTQTPFI